MERSFVPLGEARYPQEEKRAWDAVVTRIAYRCALVKADAMPEGFSRVLNTYERVRRRILGTGRLAFHV